MLRLLLRTHADGERGVCTGAGPSLTPTGLAPFSDMSVAGGAGHPQSSVCSCQKASAIRAQALCVIRMWTKVERFRYQLSSLAVVAQYSVESGEAPGGLLWRTRCKRTT